jgi:hypothetical protein
MLLWVFKVVRGGIEEGDYRADKGLYPPTGELLQEPATVGDGRHNRLLILFRHPDKIPDGDLVNAVVQRARQPRFQGKTVPPGKSERTETS